MNKSAFFNYTAAKMNLFALIACVVGAVCTLLAKVVEKLSYDGDSEKVSTSIMEGYGAFMLVLFIATAIVIFLKKDHSAFIIAAVNSVFCIFKLLQQLLRLGLSAEEKAGIEFFESMGAKYSMSVNVFFWIMVIAAIASAVLLILPAKNNTQQTYGM